MRMVPVINLTYKCNKFCPFCYSRGFEEKYKKDMKLVDFKRVLIWLKKQSVKEIGMLGGEPTIYPYFNEVVELAGKYGFSILLSTNNLFPKKVFPAFEKGIIKSAMVHITPKNTYSKQELKILNRNLGFLSGLDLDVILRLNFENPKTPYNYLIETCEKYNIKRIGIGITTPGTFDKNPFFPIEKIKELQPILDNLVLKCKKKGLNLTIANILPFCFFEEKRLNFLRRELDLEATCFTKSNFPLLIQPDLSFNACFKLPFNRKNILSYSSWKEAIKEFEEQVEKLKKKPLFEKCKECIYWKREECTGGCLLFKLHAGKKPWLESQGVPIRCSQSFGLQAEARSVRNARVF